MASVQYETVVPIDKAARNDIYLEEDERDFWAAMRQAYLMQVDAIERYKLKTNPRTAELRKADKQTRKELGNGKQAVQFESDVH